MLYLVRSSRFLEYQQENQRLLAAARGAQLIVRMGLGAVDPALVGHDLVGLPVCVLLAEPPYQRTAVIRLGRVVAMGEEQERCELTLELSGYPAPDLDQAGFDTWFADRHAGREQPDFLFLDEPGFPVPEQTEPADRETAWRAGLERVLASDAAPRYAASVFLRPVGLTDEFAEVAVDPAAVVTGRAYALKLACHAAHLSEEERARQSLGLTYDRAEIELLDHPSGPLTDGALTVRLRLLVPGSARLSMFVRPQAERSTRLDLDFRAAGDLIGLQATCEEVTSEGNREQLRGLLALLNKHGALADPELERAVLDRLLTLLPEDPELNRQLAHLHHRSERHAEAEQLFAELGPARLEPADWLPYFLSACRCNCAGDALADIVSNLPWDQLAPEQAAQIGQCVAGLPERVILSLLESLAYFGTERFLSDIWRPVSPTISSPEGVLKAYAILRETHLDTPAELYAYLADRIEELELVEPRFDELLVDNGLLLDQAPGGFGRVLLRHLRRQVDAGAHEEALVLMEQARPVMSPAAFDEVRLDLASALADTASGPELSLAGRLFADAAEAARVRGDLDEAAIWLERAALADPEGERLAEVQGGIEKAVEASEQVQILTEALFAQRVKQLRAKLAGTRLTIVGGPHEKPWVGQLRKELAVSDINWFISDMGKRPRADKIKEALGKSVGAVAIITFHVGHRAAEVVREEARK